jgi:hypothetical protein
MPVVDLVAALPQEIADHVLARSLGAAGGWYRDESLRGRKLGVEIGVDGIEDFPSGIDDVHIRSIPVSGFQNRERANRLGSRPPAMETRMPGNRNILYLIIGALVVAVGVLGYNLYQAKKEPEGLQINVGPNGLKIQNK